MLTLACCPNISRTECAGVQLFRACQASLRPAHLWLKPGASAHPSCICSVPSTWTPVTAGSSKMLRSWLTCASTTSSFSEARYSCVHSSRMCVKLRQAESCQHDDIIIAAMAMHGHCSPLHVPCNDSFRQG